MITSFKFSSASIYHFGKGHSILLSFEISFESPTYKPKDPLVLIVLVHDKSNTMVARFDVF